jgi:hypothetical protein
MIARLFALLAWFAGQSPLATESLNRFLYVESPAEVVVTVRAGCTAAAGEKAAGKPPRCA